MISSFAEHIQRYEFALKFRRKTLPRCTVVAPAMVHTFSAANGAEALTEAAANYRLDNLRLTRGDVEALNNFEQYCDLKGPFDIVVSFEHPRALALLSVQFQNVPMHGAAFP